MYNQDFQFSYSTLSEKKICPFYYYFNLLKNTNPDIIICTYKDFLDLKSRIQISQLLKIENKPEYKIIMDECADIDSVLISLSSMNIDESLLFNAANQLFVLKEKYVSIKSNNADVTMTDYSHNNVHAEISGAIHLNNNQHPNHDQTNGVITLPEDEFIHFNGFPSCQNNKFPGFMRKSSNLLNLISRLIVFFKRAFFHLKSENLWNIYKIQQQLLVELWLDLKKLNIIFKRFMLFLHEIKFLDYNS